MVEDFNTIYDMVKQFEKPNHIFIVRVIDKLVGKKSVTGTHLVVKPFYLNNRSSIYPDVHILRGAFQAGSLLYYPDSLANQ